MDVIQCINRLHSLQEKHLPRMISLTKIPILNSPQKWLSDVQKQTLA